MVCVIYSDEFLNHETGAQHPESPSRLQAVVEHLRSGEDFADLEWRSPQSVDVTQAIASESSPLMGAILQAHTAAYVSRIRGLAQRGGGALDVDTPISPHSYGVALLAVQGWLDGVEYVLASDPGLLTLAPLAPQEPTAEGDASVSPLVPRTAFVLARPPGHHACRDHGMGFCLFSNAAIAAQKALTYPHINRVAIVDWDVHHGNGTQDIIQRHGEPGAIAYCSLHQSPAYPGTGVPSSPQDEAQERQHHILNLPIPPGTHFPTYRQIWETQLLPFLKTFNPDLIIISAGYDATAADPLAAVNLAPDNYRWLTESLFPLNCPMLLGLEGGYGIQTLAQCVDRTLRPLLSLKT